MDLDMGLMGKTYYIDTAGSDELGGLTPLTAFQTFSAVNKMVLQPGDRVLLKCGCIWNEQLVINGKGTEEHFIEISSYGKGPLPKIQRDGEIGDRCVRVNNPSFVRINNLEVCNGGAGIIIFYDNCFHNRSVYLNNIVAHDFFGIYRASGENSSNEKWKSYRCDDRVGFSLGICVTGNDTEATKNDNVLDDFRVSNCEIYNTGGGLGLDWCDHKNCDGTESGKNKFSNVLFENLKLHHNNVPDVSLTSLFAQCVTNMIFRNSVIDKGAGGAPFGAAAVHLQIAENVLFDSVTIKNMPHTGTNDECGIDFETDVENCVIKDCIFENNAGAAIEMLANKDGSDHPVSRNVIITGCVFNNNNWAHIYDKAGQIQVVNWNVDNKPTGIVCDCHYDNPEGTEFVNGDGFLDDIKQIGNQNRTSVGWGMACEKMVCNI